MKTNLRKFAIASVVSLLSAFVSTGLFAQTPGGQVTLSSATPASGEPGLTSVRLLGSGFPVGNFNPANILVSLAPQAGGAPTTVAATGYQSIAGTTSRVAFLLPASISVANPAAYSISISDSSNGFASNNSLSITVTPLASIAAISPGSASPGQTLNVTITGLYSHFVTGLTAVTAGSGITVSSLIVTTPTLLTAQFAIPASDSPGSITVTVTTAGEVESTPFTLKLLPVTVPDVVGDTQAAASIAITTATLVVGAITKQSSATVPEGDVISQNPAAGASIAPGSSVNLVVSTGPANVTVPNVVGDTQAAASSAITTATLVVGVVTKQSSATVPLGDVISQNPAAGASVAPGSSVNLVVSTGPGVTVPNVVGDTQPAATMALAAAGLINGAFTFQSSNNVTSGDVISQDPAAGASVSPGSAVNLVISTGSFSAFEAVSDLVSVQNGPLGGPLLPAGQNQAVSNLISVANGPIGSTSLPAGQNQAVSALISIQNGVVGSTSLPAGENQAVSKLISVQNGNVGSPSLLPGQNEAVSDLISAQNGGSANATVKLKSASSLALASATVSPAVPGNALNGETVAAGETITVIADVPAQISLNGQRAGNDAGSTTELTFVVPEDANSLQIRAGESSDSAMAIQSRSTTLTGQVADQNGAPVPNARVQLRHAGLEAQFFKLPAPPAAGEMPSIAGLTPANQQPASSLNLHNPAQAFGYFPLGSMNAPDFAVRFSGQFLASASGAYTFFVAASDGAQLAIDGKPMGGVQVAKPGLESALPVQLTEGWHDIEIVVYSAAGPAQLVVSYAPPGGVKQTIGPTLLRAVSGLMSGLTDAHGNFTITAPVWLDQIEAIATVSHASGMQSGLSPAARTGVSSLGLIHLAPGVNF